MIEDSNFRFMILKEGFVSIVSYNGRDKNVLVPKCINSGGEVFYVKSIEPHAFFECKNVEVDMKSLISLTVIKQFAFDNCSISKLYLPPGVKVISPMAFVSSTIDTIICDENNQRFYQTEYKNRFTKVFPYEIINSSICQSSFIRETCKKIWQSSFHDNMNIRKINFPDSLEFIGISAFQNCRNLFSVSFSNCSKCTKIEAYCFAGTGIVEFCFPPLITVISEGIFSKSKLQVLRFSRINNIKIIRANAFEATELLEIKIPFSTCHIDSRAFACSKIETIFVNCKQINYTSADAFINNPIKRVVCPENLLDEIKKCKFPDNVEFIPELSLERNESASNISFPEHFPNRSKCICKISKMHIELRKRIKQVDNREDRITFICHYCDECPFKLRYVYEFSKKTWNKVEEVMHLDCKSENVFPLMNHLRYIIQKYYIPNMKCTNEFVSKISHKVGCSVTRDRISYQMMTCQSNLHKIDKWTDLISIAEKIELDGGSKSVIFTEEESRKIKYIALLPNYSIEYLESEAFFPLIIGDGTHSLSSAKGVYIIFICITGNHEILPLAFGWGPTESSDSIKNVLNLIVPHIKSKVSFITDQGTAFLSALDSLEIEKSLFHCTWHLAMKLPAEVRELLTNAMNEEDLFSVLRDLEIIEKRYPEVYAKRIKPELNSYIRFMSHAPRFGYSTSQSSESLNNMISCLRNHEPADVFVNLYYMGAKVISNLKKISITNGRLTPYATLLIDHSIAKSDRLIVETEFKDFKFKVIDPIKGMKHFDVLIDNNSKLINCSCNKYFERGIPCSHIIACLRVHSESIEIFSLVHHVYRSAEYAKMWRSNPILSFSTSSSIPAFPPSIYDRRKGNYKRMKSTQEIERTKYKNKYFK